MDFIAVPIMALLIPIIIVPTALGIKHARYLREVEHLERMRAMELGRTLAGDESWTPAGVAAAIGAGVPIAAMLIAFVASRSVHSGDALEAVWKAAGMVGLGGVICGTVLSAQQFARRHQPIAPAELRAEKPSYDPDEFDVVGRRG